MSMLPGPGTWLIFGVVLVPVYVALAAWFLGEPRDVRVGLMGIGYLIGFILLLWLPMFILSMIIWALFF